MSNARARAKARQQQRVADAKAVLSKPKGPMSFEEVADLHFTGLPEPQQWIDRLGTNQQALSKVKLENRLHGVRPVVLSPLKKEEILVRELDKLERSVRVGVVLYPRFNGGEPPHPIPAKPWEPFLPGLSGNEANWREWEVGGRSEAARNPWTCGNCGTLNRPLYSNVVPSVAPRSDGLPRERCERCDELRGAERDYTELLGLERPERARQGVAPEAGDRSFCYCNVCRGFQEQDRDNWREHYYDGDRWALEGVDHVQASLDHDDDEPRPRTPAAGAAAAGQDAMAPPCRSLTVQRFHVENRPVYEKEEFHNARLPELLLANRDAVAVELGQRGMGDDGAVAVAKALHGNTRIASVNLSTNGIGYGGAKAVAGLLGLTVSALTSLDLSHNALGASGAAALARGLERNGALRSLLLDANQVGNYGAEQMVQPLTKNRCLVVLGLTANNISTAVGDQVRAALATGRHAKDVARLDVLY